MKILVIPNRGRSFNAVRPEAECYISLAKAGHDITIMTCKTNAYIEEYKRAGLKIIFLLSLKKYSWTTIKQIRQYINENAIDIMYATESNGIPNAAFACIGTKAKMIAYRGTTGGMYKTDPSNYLCTLHPRIDGYICVSDAVKANVLSKIRESIRKSTRTIYKGHDLKWYTESPTDLSPLGVFDNDFCVLCVGSAREHKGMRYMIEATRYLTDIENFKLILVGDGFDCEPFSTEIKNTGMSDKIIQTGFRNDVPQLAGACKCLILPSLREGLPRTILESLAYGTPVITSDCGGPTEIIEEGTNGYIVPVGDAKAIADRIRLLIGNNELLEQLSNNAKKTISVKMSHAQTVTNMEQYFKDILR